MGVFSLDFIPSLPMSLSFKWVFILFFVSFLPSYIVYAKQGVSRRSIYFLSVLCFLVSSTIFFADIDALFFSREKLSLFLKLLFVIVYLWSFLDSAYVKSWTNSTGIERTKFFRKWFGNPIESFIIHFFFMFFKILPLRLASLIGSGIGWSLKFIARKKNLIALANLDLAFPKKSLEEKKKILNDSWKLLGRSFTESPHIKTFYNQREELVDIEGLEILKGLKDKKFIAFIHHAGTMGIVNVPMKMLDIKNCVVYRYPNNFLVDEITKDTFGQVLGNVNLIPKGNAGSKQVIKALKKGENLCLPADQRMNDGLELKFFGKKAMTASGVAKLAVTFNYPILPIQLVRVKGVKHKVVFSTPFVVKRTKDKELDVLNTAQKVNDIIQSWVEQYPEQWFWVHQRWGKLDLQKFSEKLAKQEAVEKDKKNSVKGKK